MEKKRVENSSGKITDKCRHVRFRWSVFFYLRFWYGKRIKQPLQKKTRKEKKQQFVFKSGTKTEWLQAIYHLTCAFLVSSTHAKSPFKEANEMIFGNCGDMTAIETQKNETENLWQTDVKIARSQIFAGNSIFKEGLDIKQVHKKLSQSVTSCSFRVLRERFDYLNSLYPCDYLAVSQTRKIPSGKKVGDCRVQDP